ncbi:caspase family protein [[Leptolyngbya] sp. PCC 7376]|uniref:caspase family protein n=1 Tax=[Leptolyngbya] sp. PCC 7376 TaxID=111781 RepID=UPI001CED2786
MKCTGIMNSSRSERQVIIIDCCFSGAFPKGLNVKGDDATALDIKPDELGGKGRAILTSSTATKYSFAQENSELSIYTHYLLDGIRSGAADPDNDGWIGVDELFEYTSEKVTQESSAMTPQFYPVKEGYKILLARSLQDDPKLRYRKQVI